MYNTYVNPLKDISTEQPLQRKGRNFFEISGIPAVKPFEVRDFSEGSIEAYP